MQHATMRTIVGAPVTHTLDATRAIVAWDGGVLAHADLHRATLTGLSDGFAEVMKTARIVELTVR